MVGTKKKMNTVSPTTTKQKKVASITRTAQQKQEIKCRHMVGNLSQAEVETAARSSYRYFLLADSAETEDQKPSQEERIKYATNMARRHLVAEKGNVLSALKKMRETIAYRDRINIDLIRKCFVDQNDIDENDQKSKTLKKIRIGLEKELSDGKHFIRGHDKDNRSLFCLFPRRYQSFDADWYLVGKLYNLERALAYTERVSDGAEEKVNVIFDYQQYSSAKEPPIALVKQLMFCLRDHYPERLRNLFFIDAPFMFRAFWMVLKPFIDPTTKKKIRFVTGTSQKESLFKDLVSEDQAMTFMLKGGEKSDDYDMQKYIYHTPFDKDMDGN